MYHEKESIAVTNISVVVAPAPRLFSDLTDASVAKLPRQVRKTIQFYLCLLQMRAPWWWCWRGWVVGREKGLFPFPKRVSVLPTINWLRKQGVQNIGQKETYSTKDTTAWVLFKHFGNEEQMVAFTQGTVYTRNENPWLEKYNKNRSKEHVFKGTMSENFYTVFSWV